jgi:hypothetical protein
MLINFDKLNEARWAACNTRWIEGHVPTMEKAAEVADEAVRAYLGIDPDVWNYLVRTEDGTE